MPGFNPGGDTGGLFGGNLGGLMGLSSDFKLGGGFLDSFNSFMGGDTFKNLSQLGSLGLGAFGLNKSLGFAEDQLGILKDQENRAATAQNFQTGNSLSLALQTTTPGTPEHERIKQAIADGSFAV